MEEQALSGLKIVEYTDFVSGPYCAKLLGDMGAEVIKVEKPGIGDSSRRAGPFPDDIPHPERSGLFLYLNTNKFGMTLDPECATGRGLLMSLLKEADIFIENHPPLRMKELGLDYPNLREANPRLVMTSITPFGQTGPYRDYRADEVVLINMGGLAYSTPGFPDHSSDPEGEPPLKADTYVAHFIAGVVGAVATILAIFHRDRTGLGSHVDVSEQEAVASMMVRDVSIFSYGSLITGRLPVVSARMPNVYLPCKDGYIVIAAPAEHQWKRLVKVLGNPDWAENELFKDVVSRTQNWDALELLLLEWSMSRTGEEIYKIAQENEVPCFPAYTIGETVHQEHLAERGYFFETSVGERAGVKLPGAPYKFTRSPWSLRRPAPGRGEHTESILSERLGIGKEDILRLRAMGVV